MLRDPSIDLSPSLKSPLIRVGLVGYGYAGKTFHAPLIQAVEGLALYGVATSNPEKVQADWPEVTIHPDAKTMIAEADIDLVVIASPHVTHAPLARLALDQGKAVVIDKPFTVTLAQARDLVVQADDTGCLLSVFHNRRWDSDFLTVRQAIEDGLIGRVTHFESRFDRFRPEVRARWREQAGGGSGVWYDLGPHLVDQALLMFGLPDRVLASLAAQRSGAETDDWTHVLLIYGDRRVSLQASMLVAGGTRRFVVHGERGSLEKHHADRQEAQLLEGLAPGGPGWGEDPDSLILHGADGSTRRIAAQAGDQRAFYAGVRDAMRGCGPNPVPPIQALAVMAVVEAAVLSSTVGAAVDIGLTEAEQTQWLQIGQTDRITALTFGDSPVS
ncbi:MAG: oxidoreductase [Alphaproteobacteria bacterium]|nr:MAG: oxidoreductase [Alphaproteobacteria bacterium]